ncbi:hypothetical protein B484DRAFT_468382 [Ochromonadaceae sp. CCMP2298]|nr:hypothetical protein B484DRAFT_468382 [Ochromonadaceae sp. CCMP2298]
MSATIMQTLDFCNYIINNSADRINKVAACHKPHSTNLLPRYQAQLDATCKVEGKGGKFTWTRWFQGGINIKTFRIFSDRVLLNAAILNNQQKDNNWLDEETDGPQLMEYGYLMEALDARLEAPMDPKDGSDPGIPISKKAISDATIILKRQQEYVNKSNAQLVRYVKLMLLEALVCADRVFKRDATSIPDQTWQQREASAEGRGRQAGCAEDGTINREGSRIGQGQKRSAAADDEGEEEEVEEEADAVDNDNNTGKKTQPKGKKGKSGKQGTQVFKDAKTTRKEKADSKRDADAAASAGSSSTFSGDAIQNSLADMTQILKTDIASKGTATLAALKEADATRILKLLHEPTNYIDLNNDCDWPGRLAEDGLKTFDQLDYWLTNQLFFDDVQAVAKALKRIPRLSLEAFITKYIVQQMITSVTPGAAI